MTNLSFSTGIDKCLYYWSQEYFLKYNYSAFQKDLNSKLIYLNEDKKVCLKTYLLEIRPVFMEQEKPERNCIANLKKLYYPTLPLTNI